MTSEKEKKTIGLLLGTLDVHREGTKKVSLEAEVLEVVSCQELRNPVGDAVEDLQVRMTVWPDPWSSVTVHYRQVWSVDEARAKIMLRKLQTIGKELQRFKKMLGDPADPTDSFMRLANAIGAEWIVEKTAGTSSRFAENEYHFMPLDIGAARLRHLLTTALASLTTPEPAPEPAPAPETTPSA